jgi:uncharacterized small protein (DUF1192 family)
MTQGNKRKRLEEDGTKIAEGDDLLLRCVDSLADTLRTVANYATDDVEVTALKNRIGSLEHQNMKLKAELYDAHHAGPSKLSKLQDEHEQAVATLIAMHEQTITTVMHKHALKMRSLKDLCALQQLQVTELSAQVALLRQEEEKLTGQIALLRTHEKGLTSQIAAQKTQVTELTAQVGSLKAEVKELVAQVASQREEMRKREGLYRSTAAAARSDKENYLARIDDLKDQLSSQPVQGASADASCKLLTAMQAVEDVFTQQHGKEWTEKLNNMADSRPDLSVADLTLHTMVSISTEWLSNVEAMRLAKCANTSSFADTSAAASNLVPAWTSVAAPEAGSNAGGISRGDEAAHTDGSLQQSLWGDGDTPPRPHCAAQAGSSQKQSATSEYPGAEGTMLANRDGFNGPASSTTVADNNVAAGDNQHGRVAYRSVFIGPCPHSDEMQLLLLERSGSFGQVKSVVVWGEGWKITFTAAHVAANAVRAKDWSALFGEGVNCRPFRDTSTPVQQRCVFATITRSTGARQQRLRRSQRIIKAAVAEMSKVGDVVWVLRMGEGFCIELADADTALTVQLSFSAEDICVNPLESTVGKIRQQLDCYRFARPPIDLASALLDPHPDGHTLPGWIHAEFCARAASSTATMQRRKTALSADAQFSTVELFVTLGYIEAACGTTFATVAGPVKMLSCNEEPRADSRGERRCATVEYHHDASARAALFINWNLMNGEGNPVECRPYRDSAVDVEGRTLVITTALPLGSTLGDELLLLQSLRACGEIVDVVRLNDTLFIVEFGKVLEYEARSNLALQLRQGRADCDVVPLDQASAQSLVLDVLGSDYHEIPAPSSDSPNSDPVSAERYRWCRGWQFPHSVSDWLRRKLKALSVDTAANAAVPPTAVTASVVCDAANSSAASSVAPAAVRGSAQRASAPLTAVQEGGSCGSPCSAPGADSQDAGTAMLVDLDYK